MPQNEYTPPVDEKPETFYTARQIAVGVFAPVPTSKLHTGEKRYETQDEAEGACEKMRRDYAARMKAEAEARNR